MKVVNEIITNTGIEHYRLKILKSPHKIFLGVGISLVFILIVTLLFLDSFLELKAGRIAGTYFGIFKIYNIFLFAPFMFFLIATDFSSEYEKKTIHHHFLNNSGSLSYILSKWLIYTIYASITYFFMAFITYTFFLIYSYGNWENISISVIFSNFMNIWVFISLGSLVGVYSTSTSKAVLWGFFYYIGLEKIFFLVFLRKISDIIHFPLLDSLADYTPFALLARLSTSGFEQSKFYFLTLAILAYIVLFLYLSYRHLSRKELGLIK